MLPVTKHPDEFTLLRHATGDLSGKELGATTRHLLQCAACGAALEQIRRLDAELRRLAAAGQFETPETSVFAPDDPFRSRPRPRLSRRRGFLVGSSALEASERALAFQQEILASIRTPEDAAPVLSRWTTARADHRLAVLYALQEAGRRSAENPFVAAALAEQTLLWLRRGAQGAGDAQERSFAEGMVPNLILRAQARALLGTSCLWTKQFAAAHEHFLAAYRSFARGGGDLTSLALVEHLESQRRGLAGDGESALVLATRARETFEAAGLEDYAARTMVSQGIALHALDRQEEAVASYRRALPIFEKFALWSNYVGALNNTAVELIKLGRADEARREFARALRRFSQKEHKYWLGYLRIGLAHALFAAGQYAQAAVSAARAVRVFVEFALRPHALIAMLLEIESWARGGDPGRARHRLDLFWAEVERDRSLDTAVLKELADALSGVDPNFERLSSLRRQASDLIQERHRAG